MAERAKVAKPDSIPSTLHINAISPLDGRYRKDVEDIAVHVSEKAIIATRLYIESLHLISLSEAGLVRPLSDNERSTLLALPKNLSDHQAYRVKEIESEIRHDVKAMERAFREFVKGTSLEDVVEMIHFGLTSEDVNNLTYRLMLNSALKDVCIPAMDAVVDRLAGMAENLKEVPMLARTHGQPAVPTTMGKEFANMAIRLHRETRKLEETELTGKFNGAVGNFNAMHFAAPELDWISYSRRFVAGLGLKPNLFTTQINAYEDMIAKFQAIQRINNIMLDINQDIWRYISDSWLVQIPKAGEVGSSTMPQKVNPIDFENSEGNLQLANSIFEGMARKLAISRLQRDLSDSTTIRNMGSALAYGLLAYHNTFKGLGKIAPNRDVIRAALDENWAILTEGVQTLLRREGVADPYSMVSTLSRGKKVGAEEWKAWVEGLDIGADLKSSLMGLNPASYMGYAVKLTEMALAEMADARRK